MDTKFCSECECDLPRAQFRTEQWKKTGERAGRSRKCLRCEQGAEELQSAASADPPPQQPTRPQPLVIDLESDDEAFAEVSYYDGDDDCWGGSDSCDLSSGSGGGGGDDDGLTAADDNASGSASGGSELSEEQRAQIVANKNAALDRRDGLHPTGAVCTGTCI